FPYPTLFRSPCIRIFLQVDDRQWRCCPRVGFEQQKTIVIMGIAIDQIDRLIVIIIIYVFVVIDDIGKTGNTLKESRYVEPRGNKYLGYAAASQAEIDKDIVGQ